MTACTASSGSPRPPRRSGLPTGFGAELALDVAMPRTQAERMIAARVGTAGSAGHASARTCPRPGGLRQPVPHDQHRCAARRREGPAGTRHRRGHRCRGRALAGADRMPQRRSAPGTRHRARHVRSRSGAASTRRTRRPVRSRQRRRRTQPRTRSACRRALRRTGDDRRRSAACRSSPRPQRTTTHPAPATCHRDGSRTRAQQPGRDRRMAAGLGRAAPALRCRDGRTVRPVARRGRGR